MGNTGLRRTSSLQRFFPNFKHEDWVEVEPNENTNRFGELTTLRNKITKQEIDRYELLFLSDRQQRIYQQCFMQRLREEHLVNAFHYQQLKSNSICSSMKGAVAYIQHIPIRLSDITDIPFDESMYIMRCSLLGFQKLFNQSGYFQVMEEHVGIDKEGHVKVWLNADLSKNYPYSFEEETHQSRDYEKIMVIEIISLIQKNTNFEGGDQNEDSRYGYIPLSVFLQRHNKKHLTFREAQEMVRQYCEKYSIQIPKKCSSVVEIFQEQYGEDFNLTNASDFLDHIDVASTEGYQNFQRQTNQRQHTMNMMSSRTKNQQRAQEVVNKPSSRFGDAHQDYGQASYKQYQPISIYKPNLKNSRASASAASSNRGGRIGQPIRLKSHKSSIDASNKMNSNRNSFKNEAIINQSPNLNPRKESGGEQNSFHDGGLYGNPSELSSNFYNQIGNDLDRIYGDDINYNRISENQLIRNSNSSKPNYGTINQNLQKSNVSGSSNSNYGIKLINTSRSNEPRYQNQRLRVSNGSRSNSYNSSQYNQNPNHPKITFTYGNQNSPKPQGNILSNSNIRESKNNDGLSDESLEYLQKRIQEQVRRDIEQELKKQNTEKKEIKKESKRLEPYPYKIYEQQNEDEVDPEIMKDLLKEFPDHVKVVY